jgi:catechol 2,3-dioxygenase
MSATLKIQNQNPTPLLSHQTPLHVQMVTLVVRDLLSVSRFYENIIGLSVVSEARNEVILGTSEIGFLRLKADLAARKQPTHMSGLFHTAFLVPTRKALAEWVNHARENLANIEGASDHGVSEAFYLSDPEGNGIEMYVDCPQSEWIWQNRRLNMGNTPIDMRGLLQLAVQPQNTATPFKLAAGSRIGHVHLRVQNLEQARAFFKTTLGFDETCSFAGAVFFSNGGYHHHIATNTWSGENSAQWQSGYLGLEKVQFAASSPNDRLEAVSRWKNSEAHNNDSELTLTAPWGTAFSLV